MENRVVCKFVTFYKHHIACSRVENAEMLDILTYWEYQIALVAMRKTREFTKSWLITNIKSRLYLCGKRGNLRNRGLKEGEPDIASYRVVVVGDYSIWRWAASSKWSELSPGKDNTSSSSECRSKCSSLGAAKKASGQLVSRRTYHSEVHTKEGVETPGSGGKERAVCVPDIVS